MLSRIPSGIAACVLLGVLCLVAGCRLAWWAATPTPALGGTRPGTAELPHPSPPVRPSSTVWRLPADSPPPTIWTPEAPGNPPPPAIWRAEVPERAREDYRNLEDLVTPRRDPLALSQRLLGREQAISRVARDQPWDFELGATHAFWVYNWDEQAYARRTARLEYRTGHAYFFVDTEARLDRAGLSLLADRFEARIYPTTRDIFGSEWTPGVDSDPRLVVLFTRGLGDSIAGYQNSLDEYSARLYPYSNEMEIIYLSTGGEVLAQDCLLAHEFQHLTQAAIDPTEETWLFEGFSELACQVNGLRSAYQAEILAAFARQPGVQLNTWNNIPDQIAPRYGAVHLLSHYILDRYGASLMRDLVAHPAAGLPSLDAVLPGAVERPGFDALFADWVIANYLNDPAIAGGRYAYTSLATVPVLPQAELRAADLPYARQTQVGQYAADYLVLHGPGNFQLDFAGATLVGLAPVALPAGSAWWGGRSTNADASLTRRFDLSAVSRATLTFSIWFEIDPGRDRAYVQVSADGQRWKVLEGQRASQSSPGEIDFGPGYSGSSANWLSERIDLTPYAGGPLWVRFEYLTDDGPVYPGIFLEEIAIPEIGFEDRAGHNADGWEARGFLQVGQALPQYWLLQLILATPAQTVVQELALNPDQSGSWRVSLAAGEKAVWVISGLTRHTSEPAEYWFQLSSIAP